MLVGWGRLDSPNRLSGTALQGIYMSTVIFIRIHEYAKDVVEFFKCLEGGNPLGIRLPRPVQDSYSIEFSAGKVLVSTRGVTQRRLRSSCGSGSTQAAVA